MFFDQWEISPSQFNVLNLLRGRENGVTQMELSRELIMHRSNMTGLVDRLEKRGLVERRANPDDRRVWRVMLTDKGRILVRKILPEYFALSEEVWGEVPAHRAKEITQELSQLEQRARLLAERLSKECKQ